jgi:hypothetical protein
MIYSNWLFKVHSGVKFSSLYLRFQSQIAIEIFKKPKAKFRENSYLFKQILSLFSLVQIQFYLSQISGKWVSMKTGSFNIGWQVISNGFKFVKTL